ncbi:MAG: hypothetical protein AAGK47_05085, partial [Bacteroidota bacterium]
AHPMFPKISLLKDADYSLPSSILRPGVYGASAASNFWEHRVCVHNRTLCSNYLPIIRVNT